MYNNFSTTLKPDCTFFYSSIFFRGSGPDFIMNFCDDIASLPDVLLFTCSVHSCSSKPQSHSSPSSTILLPQNAPSLSYSWICIEKSIFASTLFIIYHPFLPFLLNLVIVRFITILSWLRIKYQYCIKLLLNKIHIMKPQKGLLIWIFGLGYTFLFERGSWFYNLWS